MGRINGILGSDKEWCLKPNKGVIITGTLDKFMRKKRIERIAVKSLENYRYNLSTFRTFYKGKVDELTEDDIDDYILWLQEETDLKLGSINSKIRSLRTFLKFCFKQGIIQNEIEIKLLRVNETDIIPFEEPQLREIYDACLIKGLIAYSGREMTSYRDYVLMRMLEKTGMRIGEALRLNINDVDLRSPIRKSNLTSQRLSKEKYLEVRQDFL